MREALIVIACACVSCAFDRRGLGGLDGLDGDDGGALVADADVPGDAAPPSDAASDAPVVHGDPYPTGSISFFKRETCPPEWTPYEPAVGRTVLPTIGAGAPRAVSGEPLESGEDRKHTHPFSGAFSLPSFDIGAARGSNDGVAESGKVAFAGVTEPASLGIPFVQLLACKKVGPRGPRALPRGAMVFFDDGKCPAGFHQSEETQGRILIGLPKGAVAERTFGASPLVGPAPQTHEHAMSVVLPTKGYGLAIASCCFGGYVENKSYAVATKAEPRSAGLPSIGLLTCVQD